MKLSPQINPTTNDHLRRRWLYLLPAVFVTYSLAYVDRANFGFGAAAGMATTLHMTGKQISLLSSLFFLGYFSFQLPGASFARRFGVRRLVFTLLIAWGAFAALSGVLSNFWLLAIDRVLLGIAESLIFPAMLVLLTNWFTRAERSRANTLLILGNPITVLWMSVLTGYLIQAFGWQKTFIMEGLPSILWALCWIAIITDKPSQSHWIDSQAAALLEAELAAEQHSLAPSTAGQKAFLRADVILLSAQYFLWSIGVYGFVLWLPSIVRQGGSLSIGRTGLFSAVPYLAAVLLMLAVSYASDRMQKREALVWPFLLLAGLALLGSFVLSQRSFPLAFVCLVVGGAFMYAPYGPFFAIVPERVPRESLAQAFAMINCSGALGAFVGSYFVGFLQTLTGNPRAGFLLMSIALVASSLLILCLPAQDPNEAKR